MLIFPANFFIKLFFSSTPLKGERSAEGKVFDQSLQCAECPVDICLAPTEAKCRLYEFYKKDFIDKLRCSKNCTFFVIAKNY